MYLYLNLYSGTHDCGHIKDLTWRSENIPTNWDDTREGRGKSTPPSPIRDLTGMDPYREQLRFPSQSVLTVSGSVLLTLGPLYIEQMSGPRVPSSRVTSLGRKSRMSNHWVEKVALFTFMMSRYLIDIQKIKVFRFTPVISASLLGTFVPFCDFLSDRILKFSTLLDDVTCYTFTKRFVSGRTTRGTI